MAFVVQTHDQTHWGNFEAYYLFILINYEKGGYIIIIKRKIGELPKQWPQINQKMMLQSKNQETDKNESNKWPGPSRAREWPNTSTSCVMAYWYAYSPSSWAWAERPVENRQTLQRPSIMMPIQQPNSLALTENMEGALKHQICPFTFTESNPQILCITYGDTILELV